MVFGIWVTYGEMKSSYFVGFRRHCFTYGNMNSLDFVGFRKLSFPLFYKNPKFRISEDLSFSYSINDLKRFMGKVRETLPTKITQSLSSV